MNAEDEKILKTPYLKIGRKLHLLLHTGQLLMEGGADTNRIVRDMMRAAVFMGIPEPQVHLHITYTTLMLNVSDDDHSYTSFRKCRRHGANMDVIAAVNRLTWAATEAHYSLDDYETELIRITKRHRCYPDFLSCIGAGIACGGFSTLFGGDAIAFLCTAICASLGFWLRRLFNEWEVNPYVSVAIAAFVSTFFAWFSQFVSGSATPWHPMIACSLFIVPGIPLINAVDDMLNNYIIAGATRAINTLLVVGGMTFGIILTIRLGSVNDFTTMNVVPDSIYLVHAIAAAIGAIGFSVIFNVPRRLVPVTALGAILSVCLRNFFNLELGSGPIAGSFIGAAAVSLMTLITSRRFNVPTHVLSIPSVIPLVPGVLLYRVLFSIINIKQLTAGALMLSIQTGVEAVLIIISIAVGVAIPNLFARHYIDRQKRRRMEKIFAGNTPPNE